MFKTILILGGFGFIGTNLIEEISKNNNYKIIVFEAKTVMIQNPDLFSKVKVYYGDFHNEKDYEIIFKKNNIDIVIHLIGTTIPLKSNANIIYDIESNLTNTIKLLDIMKKYHSKKIVFLSSGGTVYGILKNKNKESDITSPICSYGIIKLTIEKYIYLYNYLYGIDFLILRVSNVYGEYHTDPDQGLINVLLKKILKGEPVEIWGDGSVVRDYIYVKDVVKIIVELINKNIDNEIVNIGSGKGYSVNDIITFIQNIAGNFQIKYLEKRKVDIPYSVLDINKLRMLVNVYLKDIEECIKETYEWYKSKI